MFVEARKFLLKLVRIQKTQIKKGYLHQDQQRINEALNFISKQLQYFKYANDDKMRSFFDRHHDRIRALIPGESYPGFEKLMNEFMNFQNQ
jgi:hypothetical protein